MRATVVVDGAGAADAVAAWLAATQGMRRAAFIEGLGAALDLPDDVATTRLAAGCVCCLGQVPLRVGIVRAVRSARPQALLLLLASGAHAPRVSTVTNLSFRGWRGEVLVAALDLEGLCASSGAACSSGLGAPSPVLQAMYPQEPWRAESALRLSLGLGTQPSDIDGASAVLARVLSRVT